MKIFNTTEKLNLKNRFFRSATWEAMATKDGDLTKELFKLHEDLAKGGVGAILTGYARVLKEEQPNPGMIGIYDDSFIAEYKKLTDMCKLYNTKIYLQVAYGGSMSYMKPPSEKIFAPSAIKNESTGIIPIEMRKEDIEMLSDAFVASAIRAEKSGFDGIQIHAAHGYLLSQFLSNDYNIRTDEYGGSIENRVRIISDIIKSIKSVVSENFTVLIKINSEDFTKDGLNQEDSIKAIKILEKSGLDVVEISGGNLSALEVQKNNLGCRREKLKKDDESYFKDFAIKLAKEIKIPLILTGGNRSIEMMENLHTEHGIDFFGISRPLICQPDLINQWQQNHDIKPKCISCNKCFIKEGKHCVLR